MKPELIGRAFMIRFADDLVMVFANEKDARRVWDVLPKRLGRYGLTLHPSKTRLLEFRPRVGGTTPPTNGTKGSFDLLGFTHWERFERLIERYPLPGPVVRHRLRPRAANP